MKSKLPEKYKLMRDGIDILDCSAFTLANLAESINSIIDYLAERDKPIESDGIKPTSCHYHNSEACDCSVSTRPESGREADKGTGGGQ